MKQESPLLNILYAQQEYRFTKGLVPSNLENCNMEIQPIYFK